MAEFGIGQAVSRFEDPVLVSGQSIFTADIQPKGVLEAFVLRAPMAHAILTSVDASDARKAPGVLLVLTGDEAAAEGLSDIPCMLPQNRDGSTNAPLLRPLLARDKVRHVGQEIAFIVAETLAQAKDAAELIRIDYEILPATIDAVEGAKDNAPRLYDHLESNIVYDWENGDQAAVDAAFEKAAHVTKIELINNRVIVNAMEPRPVVAEYDRETDGSILHTPSQGVHGMRRTFAEVIIGFDRKKLRVMTPSVGGGFGMKGGIYSEPALVLWSSRKLKRAVRYLPTRQDAFLSDTQGRDQINFAEMATDKEGHFLALRAITYANMGAYTTGGGPGVPTGSTDMLVGLYRTPALYARVLGVVTNTVPVSAYRGAGRPEASYLIERLVDAVARDLGLSQAEIRLRNFVQPSEIPYTTPLDDTFDSGDFPAIMEAGMEKADWAGFEARRVASRERGLLRGIGMATYIERCGGGGREIVNVEFNEDDTMTLVMGTQENGQGHWTSYAQIMAEQLDVDINSIGIHQGDSSRSPPGFTGGSRSVPMGGAAIKGAAERIVEKGKSIAANDMEVAVEDIEFADGSFTVVGTDQFMTLYEVARAAREGRGLDEGMEPTLNETYGHVSTAPTFPNGCHIVEIEIDPETGQMDMDRYTIVDDFGDVINPLLLAGQVHGGIVQGIGQALLERTVYEEDSGQLIAGSFMDYTMPRATDAPNFEFHTRNIPCTTNPLGIKGAGEAGSIGAPPAIIHAILDALNQIGPVDNIDMPATPQAIFKALRQAGAV